MNYGDVPHCFGAPASFTTLSKRTLVRGQEIIHKDDDLAKVLSNNTSATKSITVSDYNTKVCYRKFSFSYRQSLIKYLEMGNYS